VAGNKTLMLAPNNFLLPATGEPVILPSQDMVLGCYYLTVDNPNAKRRNNEYFMNYNDVIFAYEQKKISLHTPIWVRTNEIERIKSLHNTSLSERQFSNLRNNKYLRTTVGRILINQTIFKNLYL